MIKVAIVEDDDDIRKMTASLLNFYADIECIGSFSSAELKFISENTIRSQVRSIYEKLQVHTRTEALNKLHGRLSEK